jgi:hypothetical protein
VLVRSYLCSVHEVALSFAMSIAELGRVTGPVDNRLISMVVISHSSQFLRKRRSRGGVEVCIASFDVHGSLVVDSKACRRRCICGEEFRMAVAKASRSTLLLYEMIHGDGP